MRKCLYYIALGGSLLSFVTYFFGARAQQTINEAPALNASSESNANSTCLAYEPIIVTLNGTTYLHHAYGPPSYGENPEQDRKLTYVVLKLEKPICVLGSAEQQTEQVNTPAFSVENVQLVYVADKHFDKSLLNKAMRVTGQLFHGISGEHYTNVLMSVSHIEQSK